MTNEESHLWNRLDKYAQERHGYSVTDLLPQPGGGYTVRLAKLGSVVAAEQRQFSVFQDEIGLILNQVELPDAIKHRIDDAVT